MSFDDIAKWLKAASTWGLPEAIQRAISAYVRSLGSGRLEMSDDMKRFFDDEKNLRTAFEIAEYVDRIRATAIERFLGHLKYALDKRLSEAGVADTWKVLYKDEPPWVTIRKKPGGQRFEARFQIVKKHDRIIYGIVDQEGNARRRRVPESLGSELDKRDFSGKSTRWWIRERDMREVLGLGDETLCDVLAVDNVRSAHPLARQVAGELMGLFLACKQFL